MGLTSSCDDRVVHRQVAIVSAKYLGQELDQFNLKRSHSRATQDCSRSSAPNRRTAGPPALGLDGKLLTRTAAS
jgi:hypothetical protein